MNSKLILLLIIFLLIVISPSLIFSQETNTDLLLREQSLAVDSSPVGLEDFSMMKIQVGELLQENQTLEVQYKWLKEEIENLDKAIKDETENLGRIKNDFGLKNASGETIVPTTYDQVETELLLQESQKNALNLKAIDSDSVSKLWELKLADLQYQKRQLELEVKMASLTCKENLDKRKEELTALNKILQDNLSQAEALKKQISEMEKKADVSPQQLSEYKIINKRLEAQIEEKKREIGYFERENKLFEDKKNYIAKSLDYDLEKVKEQKLILENLIKDLEKQYKGINQMVKASIVNQKQINDYTQEFINIDKENQKLRQEIEAAQKKIDESK